MRNTLLSAGGVPGGASGVQGRRRSVVHGPSPGRNVCRASAARVPDTRRVADSRYTVIHAAGAGPWDNSCAPGRPARPGTPAMPGMTSGVGTSNALVAEAFRAALRFPVQYGSSG